MVAQALLLFWLYGRRCLTFCGGQGGKEKGAD